MEEISESYKQMEEVLEEIFSQKPLPNKLKKPKQDFLRGKLGATGAIRIIQEYSDYQVSIICKKTV